jgi:hypothetical protein
MASEPVEANEGNQNPLLPSLPSVQVPPQRAVQVGILIDANDPEQAVIALRHLLEHVQSVGALSGCDSTSHVAAGSLRYRTVHDKARTHEQYFRDLKSFLEGT